MTTAFLLLGGGLMGFLKGSGVASSVISSIGVTIVLHPVPANWWFWQHFAPFCSGGGLFVRLVAPVVTSCVCTAMGCFGAGLADGNGCP